MGLIKRKLQGSAFPVGTTVVSCTATDSAGNVATSSFNVIVVDDEDPAAGLSLSRLLCSSFDDSARNQKWAQAGSLVSCNLVFA